MGIDLFLGLKSVVLLTGYYGCGKTNLAVNLALDYKKNKETVRIIDLDIVNPYFRTSDFSDMLGGKGIDVVAPGFANSLSDAPSLPREISMAIGAKGRTLIDVGGDDAGAVVVGRYYSDILRAGGADMCYLFSVYRPGMDSPEETVRHIKTIETVSRQKVTYLINTSNLADRTTFEDVQRSLCFADRLSSLAGIPLLATVMLEGIGDIEGSYSVKRFVRPPWEPRQE